MDKIWNSSEGATEFFAGFFFFQKEFGTNQNLKTTFNILVIFEKLVFLGLLLLLQYIDANIHCIYTQGMRHCKYLKKSNLKTSLSS